MRTSALLLVALFELGLLMMGFVLGRMTALKDARHLPDFLERRHRLPRLEWQQ